jgi:putative DNA methylase
MTSTTNTKKKLIEVAIPLEAINAASAREKSIRHGHPSTLHLWWARRPLAACRAVLFAQLVDDPSSDLENFPTQEAQEVERKRLFGIIEDLVKWENSTNEAVLERARAEIRKSCGGELPPVYDPFSGGGSIPLEAQRLGLPAYGSDLNPVAVMIGKAMIEIPPKFKDKPPIHPGIKERQFYRNAEGLAEDVKYYGEWMREKAWERIGHLYPQVDLPKEYGGGKATVIAWIWARTVPSPDPAFAGAQVPITSSFTLGTKPGREAWIRATPDRKAKSVQYEVQRGGAKEEIAQAKKGTKAGQANFQCILSDAPISGAYIDEAASHGKMGRVLLAVVAEGARGRVYLSPSSEQLEAVALADKKIGELDTAFLRVPCRGTFASNAQGRKYGFETFEDYFLPRQLASLTTLSDALDEVQSTVLQDCIRSGWHDDEAPLASGGGGPRAYAEAIRIFLAFAIDRSADRGSTLCSWDSSPKMEALRNTFARQAIQMTWDFAEGNPFSESSGNFLSNVDWVARVIDLLAPSAAGFLSQHDAQTIVYPSQVVISSDPPYYDNIEYSDLSDFFYVWLKRNCGPVFPEIFGFLSTPKSEELVATRYRHGGQEEADRFFLDGMTKAIKRMTSQVGTNHPATIYYAFKQSEVESEGISSTGWATFLQAVVQAGFSVVGTWPMRTEMANRMVAAGTNALANSVVLVCRKKESTAEVVTRAEFIRALKRELPPAIAELQAANIAPADMPQSAIGPGMGVFSRYKAVLESDDSPMRVKTALQLINRELDEYLGGIQGEFDADTRFAITWFEQNGLKAGDYGTANSIATARGISVDSVKHAGIVESAAGKVRILSREELNDDWDPEEDRHLTVWECLQHLVRQHEKDGISQDTAVLLKKISTQAEAVKDLAYCLYDISANKRKDAKEATAYNALIADWTELTRQAAAVHDTGGDRQIKLDI